MKTKTMNQRQIARLPRLHMPFGNVLWAVVLTVACLSCGNAQAKQFFFAPPDYQGSSTTDITATSAATPWKYPGDSGTFANMLASVLSGYSSGWVGDVTDTIDVELLPGNYPSAVIKAWVPPSKPAYWQNNLHNATVIIRGYNGAAATLTLSFSPNHSSAYSLPDENAIPEAQYNYWTLLSSDYNDSQSGGNYYNRYVDIENITLDCNWDAQGGWVSPSHSGVGFAGVYWRAYTGTVKNVRVINSGSNGFVPSTLSKSVGRSVFPMSFDCVDAIPNAAPIPGGNTTPWLVSGCEVSKFHAMYSSQGGAAGFGITVGGLYPYPPAGGGATIHGDTGAWLGNTIPSEYAATYPGYATWLAAADGNATLKAFRYATISDCLVDQLPGAAFGVVGASGLTVANNVVLSSAAAFLSDSYWTRNVDFLNNACLDVNVGVYIDATQYSYANNYMQNFAVSGNLFRLSGVELATDYSSYVWSGWPQSASPHYYGFYKGSLQHEGTYIDSVLQFAVGVGNATGTTLNNNWITTRPRAMFYERDPSQVAQAVFYPCRRQTATPEGWPIYQTGTVVNGGYGLGVSSVWGDFLSLNDGGIGGSLPAIAAAPTQTAWGSGLFAPASGSLNKLGSTRRLTKGSGNSGNAGVYELQLSAPYVSAPNQPYSGTQVQARWVHHDLALANNSGGTAPEAGNIHFRVEDDSGQVQYYDSTTGAALSFPTSQRLPCTVGYLSGPPGSMSAMLALDLSPVSGNGYYRVIGYVKPNGASLLDKTTDPWSETEYLVGNTARFVRASSVGTLNSVTDGGPQNPPLGDVAIDRTGAPGTEGRAGRLAIAWTGSAAFAMHITQLSLVAAHVGRDATYGVDFVLYDEDNAHTPIQKDGTGNFLIPANAANPRNISVVPINDDITEYEAAVFAIVNESGFKRAPTLHNRNGPPTMAPASVPDYLYSSSVIIDDGPQWRLVALPGLPAGSTGYATGIGPAQPALGSTPEVKPYVTASYTLSGTPYGAFWQLPATWSGATPPTTATGISSPLTAISGAANGMMIGNTSYIDLAQTPVATTPTAFPTLAGIGSLLDTVNPGGNVSSYAYLGGSYMDSSSDATLPVCWDWNGFYRSLTKLVVPLLSGANGGKVFGITDDMTIVGYNAFPGITPVTRGFYRQLLSGSITALGCDPAIASTGNSIAYDVSRSVVSGTTYYDCVGSADYAAVGKSFATYWSIPTATPNRLGSLPDHAGQVYDSGSTALAVYTDDQKVWNSLPEWAWINGRPRFRAVGYSVGASGNRRAFLFDSALAPGYKQYWSVPSGMSATGILDLNDPSLTQISPGWTFARATALDNNQVGSSGTVYYSYIAGSASLNGGPEVPAVLVPRAPYIPAQ